MYLEHMLAHQKDHKHKEHLLHDQMYLHLLRSNNDLLASNEDQLLASIDQTMTIWH